MRNDNIYSLLIGVGDYRKMNIENLSTYRMDVMLIRTALITGLKAQKENIRIMIGDENNGLVRVSDFAKSIAGFNKLLRKEDTFILYYSGHGINENLVYSDGHIKLQSVIDFVEKLPTKNKIVILDCCYSGAFVTPGARQMHFEQAVSEFAGHGIVVMASSAANEVSRLGPNGKHSIFTGALSTAIVMNTRKKKGILSIDDINDEVRILVQNWNRQNPQKAQHHIYRSSIGGTIYFPIEEYHEYKQLKISWETVRYKVVSVKPLSTGSIKRLCAFVTTKDRGNRIELPRYTKEIVESIKGARVYSNTKSEARFGGSEARAIWCYFGCDESDIVNHLHYAYTIWAADQEAKTMYFKANRYAIESDGIYVYENISYDMLKKMQQTVLSRDEFISENKKLLSAMVSMAEQFIVDLQEVANRTLSIAVMQERYGEWIKKVKNLYVKLSDGDVAPNDLHDWAEEIINLAGWVLDLSLLLEKGNEGIGVREMWLINHAITHYYESLEKIKAFEQYIEGEESVNA